LAVQLWAKAFGFEINVQPWNQLSGEAASNFLGFGRAGLSPGIGDRAKAGQAPATPTQGSGLPAALFERGSCRPGGASCANGPAGEAIPARSLEETYLETGALRATRGHGPRMPGSAAQRPLGPVKVGPLASPDLNHVSVATGTPWNSAFRGGPDGVWVAGEGSAPLLSEPARPDPDRGGIWCLREIRMRLKFLAGCGASTYLKPRSPGDDPSRLARPSAFRLAHPDRPPASNRRASTWLDEPPQKSKKTKSGAPPPPCTSGDNDARPCSPPCSKLRDWATP